MSQRLINRGKKNDSPIASTTPAKIRQSLVLYCIFTSLAKERFYGFGCDSEDAMRMVLLTLPMSLEVSKYMFAGV